MISSAARAVAINGAANLGAERGDGVEQPPATPDQGDAEILQILGRQARQHPFIDLVRAERRLVLLEPERPQPIRDIYRGHPSVMRTAVVSYAFVGMATGGGRRRESRRPCFGAAFFSPVGAPASTNPRRFSAISAPQIFVVIRLLQQLQFVDPVQNSVDPPGSEFVI